MNTSWVSDLAGLNFLALADVVIDIRTESQLSGARVTVPLYQQVVKFHDLLPAATLGMVERACDLRWKAIKLLETRQVISEVVADGSDLWDTNISLTINKRAFAAVARAVDLEARRRAAQAVGSAETNAAEDSAPSEREVAVLFAPDKVTLPWLFRHVSVQLWVSAAILLGSSFVLGVRASEFAFFRQIAGLPARDTTTSTTRQRPVVLPRGSRVILHVRTGDSLVPAAKVGDWLVSSGYTVPAIRRVDADRAPSVSSQVRFFHEADTNGAESLANALRGWGYPAIERQYVPGFESGVPQTQYEIWFVPP